MTDNITPGAMMMVKIDGAKVKCLREEQGLTQLYLATAVQVTTDTISRWENKRYPSIKMENGLKLAASLNVELEELLETPSVPQENYQIPTLPNHQVGAHDDSKKKNKKGLIIFLSLAISCLVAGFFAYYILTPTPTNKLTVKRVLPAHTISGQPFPVIIEVTGAPEASTALILKEILPKNTEISKTVPEAVSTSTKNYELKWLKKIRSNYKFFYVASIKLEEIRFSSFDGNVAINQGSSVSAPILGDAKILFGEHHWADTNGDNSISDSEILTVYDRYSEIEELGLDIDLIEEIWLGSGYHWDKQKSSFDILE